MRGKNDALDMEICELLKQVTDINEIDAHDWTYLKVAAYHDRVRVLKFILQHPDIDPNTKVGHKAAITIACQQEAVRCLRVLLEDPRVELSNALVFSLLHEKTASLIELLSSLRRICLPPLTSPHFLIMQQETQRRVLKTFNEYKKKIPYFRKQLGLQAYGAVLIFIFVILHADGYFTLNEVRNDTTRFFFMTTKLPMELQAIICNRACDLPQDIIRVKLFDLALKIFVKDKWLEDQ